MAIFCFYGARSKEKPASYLSVVVPANDKIVDREEKETLCPMRSFSIDVRRRSRAPHCKGCSEGGEVERGFSGGVGLFRPCPFLVNITIYKLSSFFFMISRLDIGLIGTLKQ